MIRIASWPPLLQDSLRQNPYLRLYHDALGRCGMPCTQGLAFSDRFLVENQGQLEAIHIHWWPEAFWRCRGGRALQRLWGVGGLWKYLRLARKLGICVLWTVHDIEHHEGADFIDRLGYLVLARLADLCICHDTATRDAVIRIRGRSRPTTVMTIGSYRGILPTPGPREATLARLGLRDRKRTLVCAGEVRPYKGLDLAIDALRRLGDDYQLIIAGRPHEARWGEDLRERASDLPNVRFLLERVEDQVLSDLIGAADAVLLPYRRITGSSALMAALTLGRGLVASNLPFFREMIAPEPEACVFCPPGDARSLADAVDVFFQLPPDRRGDAARRLADLYDWDVVVKPVAAWLQQRLPHRCPEVPVTAGA